MKVYILMGVSGSGKTTLGLELAKKLHIPFYDADDYHPEENIKKMKNGIPLTDEDRSSWLEVLAEEIAGWTEEGGILACSALKETYRQKLASHAKDSVVWIYLYETYEVIKERMQERNSHYFKPELLKSQFETLEPPTYGIHVKVNNSIAENVEEITMKIRAKQ